MQPIDPNSFLPSPGERETAVCGQCGVMGLPAEMHRASLPVAGSLPTLPNKVTWRCRDEAACVTRITYKHRNDALFTSDDPLYAAGNVIDRLREDLVRVADDLAAVQDSVARARVAYLQEPDDSMVERAARVIAYGMTGSEGGADDPEVHRVARKALKAALYNAEEPIDEPPPPRAVVNVAGILWPDQERAYEDPAKHVQVQRIIRAVRQADEDDQAEQRPDEVYRLLGRAQEAFAQYRQGQCIEQRYDKRGDCDGSLLRTELRKPNEFGQPVGASGMEVRLCASHWQQAYRAGEVGPTIGGQTGGQS